MFAGKFSWYSSVAKCSKNQYNSSGYVRCPQVWYFLRTLCNLSVPARLRDHWQCKWALCTFGWTSDLQLPESASLPPSSGIFGVLHLSELNETFKVLVRLTLDMANILDEWVVVTQHLLMFLQHYHVLRIFGVQMDVFCPEIGILRAKSSSSFVSALRTTNWRIATINLPSWWHVLLFRQLKENKI